MNNEAYLQAHKNALDEYHALLDKHCSLATEIAETEERMRHLKETMASLARLCGSAISAEQQSVPWLPDPQRLVALGLTDAVREVFKTRPEEYLFPSEVANILLQAGYEKQDHLVSNVYTVCRRLKESQELESREIEGKTAYKNPALSGYKKAIADFFEQFEKPDVPASRDPFIGQGSGARPRKHTERRRNKGEETG